MKGDKYYYKDGSVLDYRDNSKVLYRVDGPAIEYANGSKEWWIDGKRHRIDGPAAEWSNGYKYWFINGKRHRLDGPAVEWSDGSKSWYVNGIYLSKEEFNNHPKVLKYKYEQQFYKELEEKL